MRTVSAEMEARTGQVAGRGRRRRPSTDAVILVAVSVVLAVPYLALSHVNTVDGPAHVLGGAILGPLRDSAAGAGYYEISFSWVPNALMQYTLAALTLLAGPTWAEKLFVLGYVVGLPLAFRFAIRSVDTRAAWLAFGVLPLTVNRPLLEGFYSFSYGTVGAIVAVGIALRARGRWRLSSALALGVVLVLVFLEHPLPLVIAVVVIVGVVVADARRGTPGRAEAGQLVTPLAALAPAVAMTVWFVLNGNGGGNYARYLSPSSLVTGLLGLGLPVKAYTGPELVASVLTALTIAALFLARRTAPAGEAPPRAGLALGAASCVLAYFLIPNDLGIEAVISPRTAVFVPMALLLLLGALGVDGRATRVAAVLFTVWALLLAGVRLPTQVRYDRLVGEFVSVESVIPRGATIFEARYRSYGPLDPLAHASSRVAADLGGVDLGLLEVPGPDYQERLRPGSRRPDRALKHGDLAGYLTAGGRLDYVIVVTADDHLPPPAIAPPPGFAAELRRAFEPVLTTRTGLVELYRRR